MNTGPTAVFTCKYGRSVHLGSAARFGRTLHCGNQSCKKTADENLDLGGSDPGVCAVSPPKRAHRVAPVQISFCMRRCFVRVSEGRKRNREHFSNRARIFSLTDFPDFLPISINRGALRQAIAQIFLRIPRSHALYRRQHRLISAPRTPRDHRREATRFR